MLNIQLNENAVTALGPAGLTYSGAAPDLAPDLRALVAEGVVWDGTTVAFARHLPAPRLRSRSWDLTGWECATSCTHLDAAVPVEVGVSPEGLPAISEADQVVMLRHGMSLALEVVRLVRALSEPVVVRCIVGANSTNGTFRFHKVRRDESWLGPDLDAYRGEKLIVVDEIPRCVDLSI